MKRKGFTLIELLVVIAIIAILAAILFPVYSRVKENGRANSCRSNLSQIAKAFDTYRTDHAGFAINGVYYGTAPDVSLKTYWVDKLSLGKAIFKCPSDTGTGDLSYVYNHFFNYSMWGSWGIPALYSSVEHPSKVIVFGEWYNSWAADPPHADDVASRRSGWFTYVPPDNTPDKRHLGRGNYAFWDGHVEALRPEQVGRDSGGGGGAEIGQSAKRGTMPPYCCLIPEVNPGGYVIPWWGPGVVKAKAKAKNEDKYNLAGANWCNTTPGGNVWSVNGHNMVCVGAFYPKGVGDLDFTDLAGSNRPSWDKPHTWLTSGGPGPNGGWLRSMTDPNEPHYRYPWGTMPTFNPNW